MTDKPRLFAWCEVGRGGIADQFHDRCRREYVGANGVVRRCGCVNHETKEAD